MKLTINEMKQLGACWGIYALFLLAALPAAAQMAAPPAAATATSPAPAMDMTPSQWLFGLGIAAPILSVSGNYRRFDQYVTPPSAINVSDLWLDHMGKDGDGLFTMRLHDLGESSGSGDFWLLSASGAVEVSGLLRSSEFYRDWSDAGQPLTRHDEKVVLSAPFRGGEFRLDNEDVALSSQNNTSADGQNWQRNRTGASLAGTVGGWQTRVGVANEQFTFNSGAQYTGVDNSVSLALTSPYCERNNLEATAALSQTNLSTSTASNSPRTMQWAVNGAHMFTPNLTLNGALSYSDMTRAITENAYAKSDTCAQLELNCQEIPRTALELGADTHLVDYVTSLQTGNIDATENELFVKATVRLAKQLKLRADASHWWTNNRPPSITPTGVAGDPLVWSSKDDQRLELSYTPRGDAGITAQWRRQLWENHDFGASNTISSPSLFGWWMPKEQLTLYASIIAQNFDLICPPDSGQPGDGMYTTNVTNDVVFGAAYQFTPRLTGDGSFTYAQGDGAEYTDHHILGLGVGYTWPKGPRLTVRASFDLFDTAVNNSLPNYNATWYEIRLSQTIF